LVSNWILIRWNLWNSNTRQKLSLFFSLLNKLSKELTRTHFISRKARKKIPNSIPASKFAKKFYEFSKMWILDLGGCLDTCNFFLCWKIQFLIRGFESLSSKHEPIWEYVFLAEKLLRNSKISKIETFQFFGTPSNLGYFLTPLKII
jgi:hypothetical protein